MDTTLDPNAVTGGGTFNVSSYICLTLTSADCPMIIRLIKQIQNIVFESLAYPTTFPTVYL